ncbi:MAG: helix-turn-helix domain-containing protein [Acidobacteriota bacterium]|nr:helix-turn-helix domain-containing protein [Acidobacteriota bacterium]
MQAETQTKQVKILEGEKLNQRLDYAKYLLIKTVEPIERVAADCGWTNEKAFAAIFQQNVGVTPAHYRNWHQG